MITQNNQTVSLSELKNAAYEFRAIRKRIEDAIATLNPVEVVTPTNLNAAKADWIEKVVENNIFNDPIFAYNYRFLSDTTSHYGDLQMLLDELVALRPSEANISKFFIWEQLCSVLKDGIATTKLAKCILNSDDLATKKYVLEKYGTPSEESLKDALDVARTNSMNDSLTTIVEKAISLAEDDEQLLKNSVLEAKEISNIFFWAMGQYRTDAWPIEIIKNCSAIDVRDKSSFGHPIIAIPSTRQVNGFKLAELLGHEIECHWRSSVNIASIGCLKNDDELVYEGLAALKDKCFNRNYCGTFNLNSAYYIIAMNQALEGHSFSKVAKQIYNQLPKGLSKESRAKKAWTYTYRVFRGISDTRNSDGYAFTKDRAYFEGWSYAKKLEKEGLSAYLSFSSLGKETFEKFMQVTDIKDVKRSCILDLELQQKAIEKMLKCLRYGNTQAANLVKI